MPLQIKNFEQVIFCNDEKLGLKAIIAIHSTALGPAVGGCRMWNYSSDEAALTDALRLSKGMTYKASISGLNWGGGKSVIMGDPKTAKNPDLLARFGEFVDRLGGHYITAKDVGIGSADLKAIKTKTSHVLGIAGEKASSGDPSPATAWGVYHGMKAATQKAFGTESFKGIKVALQGLGAVSSGLMELLAKEGAVLFGCDIDEAKVKQAQELYGLEPVHIDKIYDVPADVFSPCALGATVNPETLPRISAKVIAGSANNQLSTDEMGYEVAKRGVLYVPDYVINAGGLMNIYHESMIPGGYNKDKAYQHIAQIHDTVKKILDHAEQEKLPSSVVADRMAEERVAKAEKIKH